MTDAVLSSEEYSMVQFFNSNHTFADSGKFNVPLPRRPDADSPGELRSVDSFHWSACCMPRGSLENWTWQ